MTESSQIISEQGRDEALLITHCYPENETDNSGIWLKRAFDGLPVMRIGKWGMFSIGNIMKLRRGNGLIISAWIIPAGILAWLSGRPYIILGLGLDCFWAERYKPIAWLWRPVLNRALRLVFESQRVYNSIHNAYGDRYADKMHIIYLPVDSEEYYPE
jgi:hypothetical protein